MTSFVSNIFEMAEVNRKKFEFRKLLIQVSDGLGREDVRGLKNLCYEHVQNKGEDISSGVDLFNILIERDVFNADKPHFLCELLETIGRKDLAKLVTDYTSKLQVNDFAPSKIQETIDIRQLQLVSEEIGRDWKMVVRHLGLDEVTIQSIHQANFGDLKEASLQALLKWKSLRGDAATGHALKGALTEMKLMAIVHKYFA